MLSGSAQFIALCRPEFIHTQSTSGCFSKISAANPGMALWSVISKTAESTLPLEPYCSTKFLRFSSLRPLTMTLVPVSTSCLIISSVALLGQMLTHLGGKRPADTTGGAQNEDFLV